MGRVYEFPEPEEIPELTPTQISEMLSRGVCPDDRSFDLLLPEEMQIVSPQFWTPLVVAKRVAEWLRELNIKTVVDIGSGSGKFCVVAALASESRFIGIEQRSRLVYAANRLAQTFSLEDRVSFIEGSFGQIETPAADAYYLYNPFEENLFNEFDHLDEDVELSPNRHVRDTSATTRLLQNAPPGTFLITYNGFGGIIPVTYQQVKTDLSFVDPLLLWRKRDPASFIKKPLIKSPE